MLNSFFIIKQICAATYYFIILPKNNTYEKDFTLYPALHFLPYSL
ncbi:Uncharacterised protein [Capnocytophaga sputigena]|nr:Uncharacterised protein [Capnocytophaga sputigena]